MKSQTPPKPAAHMRTNPLLDRLEPAQRKVLLAGLIAFFVLAGLSTLLLAYYVFEPEIMAYLQTPTSIFSPTQTPACVGSTLQIGKTILHFESIARLADGSINVPSGTSGVAYWIEDLENNYVFALSPTPDNLKFVGALKSGEEANITWKNCNSAKYILSTPETGMPGSEILNDQSTVGIIIYVPDSTLSPGVWVQGGQVEEIFKNPETPEPGENVIDAEVSLLETSTSADGNTIQVTISVLNYGSVPITLSESDILLTPENTAPLALVQSEPSLPQEIKPGESKTFALDFPRPTSAIAILKVFTIEFDLKDF